MLLRGRARSILAGLGSLCRRGTPQSSVEATAATQCSSSDRHHAWPPALHVRGLAEPALAEEYDDVAERRTLRQPLPPISLEPRAMLPTTKCASSRCGRSTLLLLPRLQHTLVEVLPAVAMCGFESALGCSQLLPAPVVVQPTAFCSCSAVNLVVKCILMSSCKGDIQNLSLNASQAHGRCGGQGGHDAGVGLVGAARAADRAVDRRV